MTAWIHVPVKGKMKMVQSESMTDDESFVAGSHEVSLRWMQQMVGGWIERVPTPSGVALDLPEELCGEAVFLINAWCNEEGRLEGLGFNAIASALLGQHLVGDILLEVVVNG